MRPEVPEPVRTTRFLRWPSCGARRETEAQTTQSGRWNFKPSAGSGDAQAERK